MITNEARDEGLEALATAKAQLRAKNPTHLVNDHENALMSIASVIAGNCSLVAQLRALGVLGDAAEVNQTAGEIYQGLAEAVAIFMCKEVFGHDPMTDEPTSTSEPTGEAGWNPEGGS